MLTELSLLALAGLFAGVINTLAGGGSLLALPALIFVGLPADVANATNRIGVMLQSLAATGSFHQAGRLDVRGDARLIGVTLIGATSGSLISVELDAETMRRVIGLVMLAMLPVVLLRPSAWLAAPDAAEASPEVGPLRLLGFLAVGVYGGFIQAGVGVFLLAGLVLLAGREPVAANATKVLLVLLLTVPALIIFGLNGLLSWPHGLALAFGSSLGGWLGSRLSLRGGPRLIQGTLLLVIAVSATKLLGLW